MSPRISIWLVAIAVLTLPPPAVGGERPTDQVAPSDWSGIRAAYEAGRHAVEAVEGGYQARNPGQAWLTRFDGRGFVTMPDSGGWSWGLELVSYGREGGQRAVCGVAPVMNWCGQRVEYDWDEALTEWYVNDTRGLEHGYTVHQRPEDFTGETPMLPLQFTLAVRGDLRPRISGDGRGVTFVNAAGTAVVNYSGLTVFDAKGRTLPAWFEKGSDQRPAVGNQPDPFTLALRHSQFISIVVEDSNAVYPLTIDPVAQQAYLKASNTGANDRFGISVAVSGDTVVVGANLEDSSATGVNGNQGDNSANNSGAAYVFVRSGTTWSQQAYLKASNTGAADEFGSTVAVSGDIVVVGAVYEASNATGVNGNQGDNSAAEAGAAYVFVRNGTIWSQHAYLKASNTEAGDRFGRSVAVSGDTVVVGAQYEASNATGVNGNQADNTAENSGAAYVFFRDAAGVWNQQAYLKASNTATDDAFGVSAAVSGDTAVVGADAEDSNATGVNGAQADNSASGSGAAYVFVRSGGVWSQQAYLKASNTGTSDCFGETVAVSGDTAIVGAPFEDSNATGVNGDQADDSAISAGAAYLFVRDGGGVWSQQAYLKASNTESGDRFGRSAAVSGDRAVVGAERESSSATGVNGNQADNSAQSAGAAYSFVRSDGVWSQQDYLKASNTQASGYFGVSVAVSGDTVVVGSELEASSATGVNGNQSDNSAGSSGAVYVFVVDTDDDGVRDSLDGCPRDPEKTAPGECGCGGAETDSDADGIADCIDNCPEAANAGQEDTDANGVGDACDDTAAGACCGGGLPALMPLAVLGMIAARRRRNRRASQITGNDAS